VAIFSIGESKKAKKTEIKIVANIIMLDTMILFGAAKKKFK
jgi:hypothetical protein